MNTQHKKSHHGSRESRKECGFLGCRSARTSHRITAIGIEPSAGTREMAKLFGLKLNKYTFIETTVDGVFACGASTGPADLEDSISSAGLVAMKAIATVRRGA